jgi:hypothetical protein
MRAYRAKRVRCVRSDVETAREREDEESVIGIERAVYGEKMHK